MNARELLQKEIWSKRTSRKILIGFGKILIGLGIVVVGVVAWITVSSHWITAAERNTGRAALVQIDALQKFNEMSDAEYDVGALQAKRKIDSAEQAAWTVKDRWVYINLEMYFILTDAEMSDQRWKRKKKFHQDGPEVERLEKVNLQNAMVRDSVRQRLHKALD